MSDPMSNVEIEDVLSSIRRLVSEDLRPAARRQAVAGTSKLVLTPAFRVETGSEDEDAPAPDQAPEIVTRIAELEAAVAARADEFEPDGSEVAATPAESWDEPRALSGEDDAQVAEPEEMIETEVETDPVAESTPDAAEQTLADDLWVEAGAEEDGDVVVEAIVGAVVGAVSKAGAKSKSDDWEEHAAMDTVDWQDAEVTPEASAPGDPKDEMGVFDEADEVFDEEMLRELVRDLIRQELQGALGQRITRNVRKLVRAEINRALAVRDFE